MSGEGAISDPLPQDARPSAQGVSAGTGGLWLSAATLLLLFAYQYFVQSGSTYLPPDSRGYLAVAAGERLSTPYTTRLLQPALAWLVAHATGLSLPVSFHLLTLVELVAAFWLLDLQLCRLGLVPSRRALTLVACGAGPAAMFGHAPVLVDPLLLLLAVAGLEAADRRRLGLALLLWTAAAATKEYGAYLGFVWAGHALRQGLPLRRVIVLSLVPTLLLVAVTLARPSASHGAWPTWQEFAVAAVGYHMVLIQKEGLRNYPRSLYIWAWAGGLPALAVGLRGIARAWSRRLDQASLDLLVVLPLCVVLAISEWERSFLIVLPFACRALPGCLAGRSRAWWLLAAGSLTTALGRPLHTTWLPPWPFLAACQAISLLASLLFLVWLFLGTTRRSGSPVASR